MKSTNLERNVSSRSIQGHLHNNNKLAPLRCNYGAMPQRYMVATSNYESRNQRLIKNKNTFKHICIIFRSSRLATSTDVAAEKMSTCNAWCVGLYTSDMVIRGSPKKWKQKHEYTKALYFETSSLYYALIRLPYTSDWCMWRCECVRICTGISVQEPQRHISNRSIGLYRLRFFIKRFTPTYTTSVNTQKCCNKGAAGKYARRNMSG